MIGRGAALRAWSPAWPSALDPSPRSTARPPGFGLRVLGLRVLGVYGFRA